MFVCKILCNHLTLVFPQFVESLGIQMAPRNINTFPPSVQAVQGEEASVVSEVVQESGQGSGQDGDHGLDRV